MCFLNKALYSHCILSTEELWNGYQHLLWKQVVSEEWHPTWTNCQKEPKLQVMSERFSMVYLLPWKLRLTNLLDTTLSLSAFLQALNWLWYLVDRLGCLFALEWLSGLFNSLLFPCHGCLAGNTYIEGQCNFIILHPSKHFLFVVYKEHECIFSYNDTLATADSKVSSHRTLYVYDCSWCIQTIIRAHLIKKPATHRKY